VGSHFSALLGQTFLNSLLLTVLPGEGSAEQRQGFPGTCSLKKF
jgi:hypothetical protein